jgi:phosphinothricin acetyltransferase
MQILPATEDDLADIQAVYAHHVLHGTGTFEEVPPSLEEMTARFAAVRQAGYTWLVARDALGCLGYGYYGPFRARAAYRFTAEDSVYVRAGVQGKGVGRALLTALLAEASAAGFTQMLALIGDSQNLGSVALHERLGFQHIGTMRDVGFKHGRWLDVVTMQRGL